MGLLLTSEAAGECELGRDVADNCETGSENRNTKCLKAPLDLVLKKHDWKIHLMIWWSDDFCKCKC